MNSLKRNLTRFGVLTGTAVLGVAVSALVAAPQAAAATHPAVTAAHECVTAVQYLAPTTLAPNQSTWVGWTNTPSEVDGTFVFDQHVLGGVYPTAILPAFDQATQSGYVTIRNLDSVSHTFAGWFNLISAC
jgi:hypothetical protein